MSEWESAVCSVCRAADQRLCDHCASVLHPGPKESYALVRHILPCCMLVLMYGRCIEHGFVSYKWRILAPCSAANLVGLNVLQLMTDAAASEFIIIHLSHFFLSL